MYARTIGRLELSVHVVDKFPNAQKILGEEKIAYSDR